MQDRSGIDALLARYLDAYRAGDAPGCAATFTPDGVVMSPFGPLARGRTQIAALHADWVAEGASGKRVSLEEFGQDGDLAWGLARFSDGAETGDGLSLSVLERQPDGHWLFRICSLNEADAGDA